MSLPIDRITLKGYRSIRSLEDFELGPVNILIGANGAGKSNFVSFFSLLSEMVKRRLALAVNRVGGADAELFLGPQVTKRIEADLKIKANGYEFKLEPTADNRLIFSDERIKSQGVPGRTRSVDRSIGRGQSESKLKEQIKPGSRNVVISRNIYGAVSSWTVYHFHDTSETGPMRRTHTVRDNDRLLPDGANLAAFLFRLQEEAPSTYQMIGDVVDLVAPFFKEFRLRPKKARGDESLQLEWTQKSSDYPFHAGQFSDGTIRFIGLATALLQPNPPATILIDEPELGLHPYALNILASLIRQASKRTQLIVSTQSAGLLNGFEPKDIVVIDREGGESKFRRLKDQELRSWLEEDYSLGELWQKEVYGGAPTHE